MSDRKLLALGALAGVGYGVLEIAGVVVGGASNPVPFDIVPSTATAARTASTRCRRGCGSALAWRSSAASCWSCSWSGPPRRSARLTVMACWPRRHSLPAS
jgi:hypothetical protein